MDYKKSKAPVNTVTRSRGNTYGASVIRIYWV